MPTVLSALQEKRVRQAVVVLVDGLGWINLREFRQLAPTLMSLSRQRITTVAPSTTAAAITTLTTGVLPAQHGLLGYQILNPETNSVTQTLKEWGQIAQPRRWQRHQTVFERADALGFECVVAGRPAHATSGFTGAVLTGGRYVAGQTIAQRTAALQQELSAGAAGIYYLYVDELDKAGHSEGAGSQLWQSRLQQLDAAVAQLLCALPRDAGLVLTADHGMLNLTAAQHRFIEDYNYLPEGTRVGGEPRHRHFYLPDASQAGAVADQIRAVEGANCWVATRQQWAASGIYGSFAAASDLLQRLGDVIMVPRKRLGYFTQTQLRETSMVGFHGGLDDDELGVPLLTGGVFVRGL